MKDLLQIKPKDIIEIIIRRRWFLIIPFCLSMIAGIYFAVTLPRIYSAQTLIFVEPQRVPESYVRSTVAQNFSSRIGTISQQLLSRTNLEKIMNEFLLLSSPEYEGMYLIDKLAILRKSITIRVTRARGGDAFTISFKGKEPGKIKKVVDALASSFINANLKVREEQAVSTSEFLESELNIMRKKLEENEEALQNYKKRYMGELPEQLDTNLSILSRFQEQLSDRQRSLLSAKNRLNTLENMISQRRFLQTTVAPAQNEPGVPLSLSQLKAQLVNLQGRYSDRHPDVIKLKGRIAKIEAEIKKEAVERSGESSPEGAENRMEVVDSEILQRNEIRREIESLEANIEKINNQIKVYQKRVEAVPKREQELMSLNRDYNNIQASYTSLLGRKLEAEIAVNLERVQKGERFRIIDYAEIPEKPISPKMMMLFAMALAAGLGIGGGFIFILEFLDTSFRKTEDIESFLGLPVVAALPTIFHPRDKKRQRVIKILNIVSLTFASILFLMFSVLILIGVDRTLGFVGKYISI